MSGRATSPLVSIAIPSYNYARYLEQAIRSAMNQTYGNLEILVSDDASTDDSARVIESLANEDRRIRFWINERNVGMQENYRLLREQCRGEFIALPSADDFLFPDHIERAVDYYRAHPECDVRYASYVMTDESGAPISLYEHPTLADLRSISPREELAFALSGARHVHIGTVVFPRRTLERAGAFSAELTATDSEFFLRCASLGMRFAYEAHVTSAQRRHGGEVTAPGAFAGRLYHEVLTMFDRYLTPEAARRCVGRRNRVAQDVGYARAHMERFAGAQIAAISEKERILAERVASKIASIPERLPAGDVAGPRFSIVLPATGRLAALKRSIDSVLNQRERSWELIVVTSDNRTIEGMLRTWVEPERLVYVEPKRTGNPAAARNAALRVAQGESIAYLDAGDVWHPEYLTAVSAALDGGADVVRSQAIAAFYEAREDGSERLLDRDSSAFGDNAMPLVDALGPSVPLSSVVHRAYLCESVATFDEHLPLLEDWEMLARLCAVPGIRIGSAPGTVESALYLGFAQQHVLDQVQALAPVFRAIASALRADPAPLEARLRAIVTAATACLRAPTALEPVRAFARTLYRRTG